MNQIYRTYSEEVSSLFGIPILVKPVHMTDIGPINSLDELCFPDDPEEEGDLLNEAFNNFDVSGIIAYQEKAAIGCILGRPGYLGFTDWFVGNQGRLIFNVAVHPNYQRKGLFNKLWTFYKKHHQAEYYFLDTRTEDNLHYNGVLIAYQKLGFEIIHTNLNIFHLDDPSCRMAIFEE
ncbi:MAG: GNAT family N-acetyltransferase [archaeon]